MRVAQWRTQFEILRQEQLKYYSKSRVLSLQLLNRLCDMPNGHKQVSDAISMLRLRFGEPVRFKFLVGMLNSHNASGFQVRDPGA